jgi:hypothetical protein
MTFKKTAIAASLAAFLLAAAPFAAAYAADATGTPPPSPTPSPAASGTPTPAQDCTITQDDLVAINAAAANDIQAELAARKALLTRIINCATENAQELQGDLANVQASGNTANLQSELAGNLNEAISYYALELQKVQTAGISGTEAIANEVLSWRTGNYDPLANEVANFILWSENQNVFNAANTRLADVANIVSFVEQAAPNPTLAQDLASAQSLITAANAENTSAENALIQSEPSDATLALITSSLQSLSDAYQQFSNISGIVQQLLPSSPSSSGQ